MRPFKPLYAGPLCAALLVGSCSAPASAGTVPQRPTPALRDGQHDFDFELGTWHFHVRKRVHPLSGSGRWIELDGTSRTCRIWSGRAQLEQAQVRGASGSIEGMTLRLYNPRTGQWSLYWATSRAGALAGPPNVGEFKNGVGKFYSWDTYEGRYVLIRYVWSRITPTSAHFEQAFSGDGGKSWEVNWITDQTRIAPGADCAGGAK